MKKKKEELVNKITITRNKIRQPFYSILVDGKEIFTQDPLHHGFADSKEVSEIEFLGIFHLIDIESRMQFIEWAYNALKKGGTCRIVAPHWSHSKAYMDPGVIWPPVTAEFFYLCRGDVRKQMAPHVEFPVDFDYTVAGSYDSNDAYVAMRNDETKSVFMHRNINTTTDIIVTLIKR